MANAEIQIQRRGQGLIITFSRPDIGNALTLEMAGQLFNILKNATSDRSTRAILLCGSGNNFMSGLDESFYAGPLMTVLERSNQLILPYHSCIREIQTMDKPVLAAVEGIVGGPGLSFTVASDLVIAARGARFSYRSAQNAMSPDGGCSFFLPRKIGLARANDMLMTGREMDAKEALDTGLINRLVDDAQLQDQALAWFDQLVEGPTKAYAAIKKLTMKAFENDLNGQLGLEHNNLGQCGRSFDFREVNKAHTTNQPAKFTGT